MILYLILIVSLIILIVQLITYLYKHKKNTEDFIMSEYTTSPSSGYSFTGKLNPLGKSVLQTSSQTGVNSSQPCSLPETIYMSAPTPSSDVYAFCSDPSNISTYYPPSKSVSINIGSDALPNIITLPPNTIDTCIWDIMYNKFGIPPSILTTGYCDSNDPTIPISSDSNPEQTYLCHQQLWKAAGCTKDLPPFYSQLDPYQYGWATGYLNNTNGIQGISKQWLYDDAKLRASMNYYNPVCYLQDNTTTSPLTSGYCDSSDPTIPISSDSNPEQTYLCHQQIWKAAGCTKDLPPFYSQLDPYPYGWATGYLNNTNGIQGISKQWLYDDAKLRSTIAYYNPVCYENNDNPYYTFG